MTIESEIYLNKTNAFKILKEVISSEINIRVK